MTPDEAKQMLAAFRALRSDVEQFDTHLPATDGGLFSDKVPPVMKSYLVNWLRKFTSEYGDRLEASLEAVIPPTDQPQS